MLPLLHPFALLQSGLLTQQCWTRHSLRWLAEAAPSVPPASAVPRMSSPVAPQPEPAPARRASPQTASRRRAR